MTSNVKCDSITASISVTTPSIKALGTAATQSLYADATALINLGTSTSTLTTAGGISTNTLEAYNNPVPVTAYTLQTGTMQIGSATNTGVATNVGICVAPITTGSIRTINIGKTTVDSVHVANVEHTGPAIGNATAPAAGLFEICTAQTTGILNIGTGARTGAGAINLGTGSSTSAINIGNKTATANGVTISAGTPGITLSSGTTLAGINVKNNTVDVVTATEALDIGTSQITGILNIGTGARTTTGAINLGTGSTTSAINIGNKTGTANTVVINSGSAGIKLASGTTLAGINVSGNTVDVVTATEALDIGTSQLTGILNIGTGARTTTGVINLGTGNLSSTINIGNSLSNPAGKVVINSATPGTSFFSGGVGTGINIATTVIDTTSAATLSLGTANATTVNINSGTNATNINGNVTLTKPLALGSVPTADTQLGFITAGTFGSAVLNPAGGTCGTIILPQIGRYIVSYVMAFTYGGVSPTNLQTALNGVVVGYSVLNNVILTNVQTQIINNTVAATTYNITYFYSAGPTAFRPSDSYLQAIRIG